MIKNEKLYTFLAGAGLLVIFHYSFKYMILRRHDDEVRKSKTIALAYVVLYKLISDKLAFSRISLDGD